MGQEGIFDKIGDDTIKRLWIETQCLYPRDEVLLG